MRKLLLALSLTLPALSYGESCIVQKYRFNPDSQPQMVMLQSSIVQLNYLPGNQEDGGDTVFHSEKIKGDMLIERSAYFEEGIPSVTVSDTKTGLVIAKSVTTAGEDQAKSPMSTGFAILNFTRNGVVYQMVCE